MDYEVSCRFKFVSLWVCLVHMWLKQFIHMHMLQMRIEPEAD